MPVGFISQSSTSPSARRYRPTGGEANQHAVIAAIPPTFRVRFSHSQTAIDASHAAQYLTTRITHHALHHHESHQRWPAQTVQPSPGGQQTPMQSPFHPLPICRPAQCAVYARRYVHAKSTIRHILGERRHLARGQSLSKPNETNRAGTASMWRAMWSYPPRRMPVLATLCGSVSP